MLVISAYLTAKHSTGCYFSFQALIAARNYENGFDLIGAVNFAVEEVRRTYPSTQDIFYILPVFNLMSFANISFKHCANRVETGKNYIVLLRIIAIKIKNYC